MQNSQKETGVNYQFSAKYLVIPTYKKSFLSIKNILQKRYFPWSLLKKSVFYQRFQNILSFETSLKNQRDVCLKPFFSIWVPGALVWVATWALKIAIAMSLSSLLVVSSQPLNGHLNTGILHFSLEFKHKEYLCSLNLYRHFECFN